MLVEAFDPHVAFTLLRVCGGPLHTTKEDVCRCSAQCTAVDTSDHAWHLARLSLSRGGLGLSRGGLGLHSLAQHSPAAYITSLCTSGSPCFSNSVV